MQWSGTGAGDTGRPGETWGGMQASPAPQAAPFDAVAATLSRSLRFQLFRTSIFTKRSATAAPMNRIGAHASAAALTTRNCVSKSSRSSSNLPQLVVLSTRHRVSTSWKIAAPRTPQPALGELKVARIHDIRFILCLGCCVCVGAGKGATSDKLQLTVDASTRERMHACLSLILIRI